MARLRRLTILRRAISVCVIACGILLSLAAQAQTPSRNYRCNATALLSDNTIKACTDLIQNTAMVGRALADAYTWRGRAYIAKGSYDLAIADFTEALKNEPAYLMALRNRGNAYQLKQDYDRAIADYTEAIWLAPRDVTLYQDRAHTYEAKADYAKAVEDYSEAIRISPRLVAAYKDRCYARMLWNRELKEALDDCDEALRLIPRDMVTLERRGFTLLRLNNPDRAIVDFDAILRVVSTNAAALYGRGIAKKKKYDDFGAAQDISAARQIRPDIVDQLIRYGFK